ncbi:MAG: tol-pal system protein YbgF [Deltaproteobacteria bacterium]|nr:tol-pal system protein YbgF [Deltaproteobacteria bacterium]
MVILQRVILFALLCSAAGCATRADMESLETNTNDARRRIVRLEKEMVGIRQMANDEVQISLQGLRNEMAAIRKGTADLQASQDTIRVDMQEMSGKADDVKILVQKSIEEGKFLKEETERRLEAMEDRLAKLEKKIGDQQTAAIGPSVSTPEGIYEGGLAAFKAGEMQKARDHFDRVIEQHPTHALVPNCHYWIGETYYSEKNYEQAILAFQDVIKNFSKSDKTPAALLKQGMSFMNIGDKKSARYVLNKLKDDYPQSEDAKKGRALLKEL